MELIRADRFSLEQLTQAYNQTRIDYIVPMLLDEAGMARHIHLFDVDLRASIVAVYHGVIHGLGMLGIRKKQAWITRVGVVPQSRGQGIATAIIRKLEGSAVDMGLDAIWAEVISGNVPAYQLFASIGFHKTQDLIVARRLAENISHKVKKQDIGTIRELTHGDILTLLEKRRQRQNWRIETATYLNISNLRGLSVQLRDGSTAWVCYSCSLNQIDSITLRALHGDAVQGSRAILYAMHSKHATHEAVLENLPVGDNTWSAFSDIGYFQEFQRTELVKYI